VPYSQRRCPSSLACASARICMPAAGCHRPQCQRGRPHPRDGRLQPHRQRKVQGVGQQPRRGCQHQRVAHQFAHEAAFGVARHGPDRSRVEHRHAHADQQSDQQQALGAGQPLGNGQADEEVEPKRDLGTGRMQSPVHMLAQTGYTGHCVGQGHAQQSQSPTGGDQAGRPRESPAGCARWSGTTAPGTKSSTPANPPAPRPCG